MALDIGKIKEKANEVYQQVESVVRNEIDDERNPQAAVRRVILAYSGTAAAFNLNPIPFSGFAMLTPIHVAMVLHVGQRMGHDLTMENAGKIFKEILGAVGVSVAGRLVTGALLKIGLPVVGGVLRAPAVFAMTYGIGRVAEDYFQRKNDGLDFDKDKAQEVFAQAVEEGRAEGAHAEKAKKQAKKRAKKKAATKKK